MIFRITYRIKDLFEKAELLIPDRPTDENQHTKPKSVTGYPDRWYAIYHMISLAAGKNFIQFERGASNAEILNYGNNHYGTGDGFRKCIQELDINKMVAFVRSLPIKDRKKWKKIIIDISNNDADILSWVKDKPN